MTLTLDDLARAIYDVPPGADSGPRLEQFQDYACVVVLALADDLKTALWRTDGWWHARPRLLALIAEAEAAQPTEDSR